VSWEEGLVTKACRMSYKTPEVNLNSGRGWYFGDARILRELDTLHTQC
jgi:hypothetical protein